MIVAFGFVLVFFGIGIIIRSFFWTQFKQGIKRLKNKNNSKTKAKENSKNEDKNITDDFSDKYPNNNYINDENHQGLKHEVRKSITKETFLPLSNTA